MAYRYVLSLVLWYSLTGLSRATYLPARSAVPEGYQRIAWAYHVPPESLYALALAESSVRLPRGERPWPWTINVAGRGYRYATRRDAWQALRTFMQHAALKQIDVGIAQVNLGWNGRYFRSGWQALDPYVNLSVAARLLRRCWDARPGSWLSAAGCYHHPAGGKPAALYTAIVIRKLDLLQASSAAVFTIPPDRTLVWSEPRSFSR